MTQVDTADLIAHPAAELFPMMSADELGSLADDIAANGLLEPIIIFHGQILDGRNRFAACKLADVEPQFIEMADTAVFSPTLYVLSRNLHRRHLTVSQRAAIAAETVPLLQEEAKKRQGRRTDLETLTPSGVEVYGGRSNQIAAEALNVGERSVCRAVKVRRENPEEFERVKRGEISVHEACREEQQRGPRKPVARPREDSAAPFEANTEKKTQKAESQKQKLITGLSTITGICRGLQELDIPMAFAVCDDEERKTWIDRAKKLTRQLRAFSTRLQEGK